MADISRIHILVWGTDNSSYHIGLCYLLKNNFGEFVKSYINTLNVLNFGDAKYPFTLNALGVTLSFLSKIFISYGIYQTVSAFRKHGRS